MAVQFTTEVFRPDKEGVEIEIIDFDGSGWSAKIVGEPASAASPAQPEIRLTANILRPIKSLPAEKSAIALYVHETFEGLVHLSLGNYSDAEGARMIRLVLEQDRRPVVHKDGLPPVEAVLDDHGGLEWIPFPKVR